MDENEATMSEYNHDKLCSTMNNSMAISMDGDVYVWGKTNQGLFNELPHSTFKIYPGRLNLHNKYQYYKAIHVSNGLSHAATVLKCQLSELIGTTSDVYDIVTQILEKQRHKIEKLKIDIVKKFKGQRKVDKKTFDEFLSHLKVQYNLDETNNMNLYYDNMKHKYEVGYVDVVYFFYLITRESRQIYKALIWGNTSHGRLGLAKNVVEANKLKRKTGKDSVIDEEEEDDDDDEDEFIQKKSDDRSPSRMGGPGSNSGGSRGSVVSSNESESALLDQSAKEEEHQNEAIATEVNVGICVISEKMQFVKVSCGHHHTLAITNTQELFVWGMGSQGCLGNSLTNDIHRPTHLSIKDQLIVEIVAGAYHSMALTKTNNLYSWGVNSRGQLGVGNMEKQLQPSLVDYFERKGERPTMLSAGDQHSAVITERNQLYMWGNGDYYRLGHGTCMDELEPKLVDVLQDVYVNHVSCGTNHSLCITNEGFIYAWGSGMNGKLGFNSSVYKDQVLPQRVGLDSENFRSHTFYQVSAGTLHSMGLSSDGLLFSWGSNKNGLLGYPTTQTSISMPQKLIDGKDLNTQNVFRLKFFKKYAKGSETHKINSESIYPMRMAREYPTEYVQDSTALTDGLFKFAVAGEKNTLLLNYKGVLYMNGSSQAGMLTQDPSKVMKQKQTLPNMEQKETVQFAEIIKKSIFQPFKTIFFEKTQIKYIACAYSHAIAISVKNIGYCWGLNLNFQLGLGYASENVLTPIRLSGALEQKRLIQACCGDKYSAVLTDQGEVWTFGTSESGVLGHDEKNYYIVQQPRMINYIPPMMYLTCGGQSMISIEHKTQKLWVWGSNQYGQLGVSLQRQIHPEEQQESDDQQMYQQKTKDQSQTVIEKLKNPANYIIYKPRYNAVRGLQGELEISQVSCGTFHSVLISSSEQIYSCGLLRFAGHQSLGTGDDTDGKQQSDQDKEKWKLLRLKEFVDQFSIIRSVENFKFTMVATQEFHSLALTDDGQIWGWGSTSFGKMGPKHKDSAFKQQSLDDDGTITPLRIPLVERAIFVCCGTNHCVAIGQSLKAYGWGCIMGGRIGVSFKRLFDQRNVGLPDPKSVTPAFFQSLVEKSEFWNKYLSTAMEIHIFEDEENIKFTADQEDNKSMRSKAQKENSITKTTNVSKSKTSIGTENKKKEVEPDISLDDDEILDEASLHSSNSSDQEEQNEEYEPNATLEMQEATRKTHGSNTFDKSMLLQDHDDPSNEPPTPFNKQQNQNQSKSKGDQLTDEYKKVFYTLQKALFAQNDDCESENLYKQDQDIDAKVILIYQEVGQNAFKLRTNLNVLNLHLSEIMEYRARNIAIMVKSKSIQELQFIVPQFIIENIQLYEAIFSYIHYHPCYMMRLIETNELNKSQITKLINVIYKNSLLPTQSQVVIMTLAIKTFQDEFDRAPDKMEFLQDMKVLKSSSSFYPLYIMYLKGNEHENTYLIKFAKLIVHDYFFMANKRHFENLPDKIRGTKMMHFLNLYYEFNNAKQQELKLECLGRIIIQIVKKMIKEKEDAQSNNEQLLSNQTLHFHHDIISYMKPRLHEEYMTKMTQAVDYDKDTVAEKMQKFDQLLLHNLDTFIIALFYGSLTEFVVDEQLKVQDYEPEFRMFLDAESNLRQIAQCIDRFLQKEPFQQVIPCYEKFNLIINERRDIYHPSFQVQQHSLDNSREEFAHQSPNLNLSRHKSIKPYNLTHIKRITNKQPMSLNLIIQNAQYLYSSVLYQLETQNLKEIVGNSFEYEERYLQIQDILQIQGFYCSQIEQHPKKIKRLFVRGTQDPIYQILKQLQFKIYNQSNFSTELLKRKINLKLLPNPLMQEVDLQNNPRDICIFRCDICSIILHRPLITIEQEHELSLLQQNGWQCIQNHSNKLDVLDCEEMGCDEFIDKSTLKCTRLFSYFYLEKNIQADLLQYIIINIDFDTNAADFFQLFNILKNQNRIKKNQKLAIAIDQFFNNILDSMKEKEEDNKEELDDSVDEGKDYKTKFNQTFLQIYEESMVNLAFRAKHRKLQLYYLEFLKQLEISYTEKNAKLKNMQFFSLNKSVEIMIYSQTVLKSKMKIYQNDAIRQSEIEDEEEEMDSLNVRQVLAFGYFTSLNLFQQAVLVKITYQGKMIQKITKSLKFYFYAQADGGWVITIVYMQEAFLNNLVRYIPQIWPNELQIQTIHILIDQYLELKRMAKYRTQITFKNESVETTFNIRELIQEMKNMDEKIL